MDAIKLAQFLRKRGFYVARHANWLLVMKDDKIVATIYVYPDFKEVTVVERERLAHLVKEVLRDYKVTVKEPNFLM